jgi:hypothetical protein
MKKKMIPLPALIFLIPLLMEYLIGKKEYEELREKYTKGQASGSH